MQIDLLFFGVNIAANVLYIILQLKNWKFPVADLGRGPGRPWCSPPPLFWINNIRNHKRRKSQQGKQNKTIPTPPSKLKVSICHWIHNGNFLVSFGSKSGSFGSFVIISFKVSLVNKRHCVRTIVITVSNYWLAISPCVHIQVLFRGFPCARMSEINSSLGYV